MLNMDKEVLNSNDNDNNNNIFTRRWRTSSLISLKSKCIDEDDDSEYYDTDESENTSENTSGCTNEYTRECKELFIDNLECVNKCNCLELVIVDDNYNDYEIINESRCIPIKNRYRKQTWYEYFRKLYMVSVILIVSIIVYFYYSYGNRKDNVANKL